MNLKIGQTVRDITFVNKVIDFVGKDIAMIIFYFCISLFMIYQSNIYRFTADYFRVVNTNTRNCSSVYYSKSSYRFSIDRAQRKLNQNFVLLISGKM